MCFFDSFLVCGAPFDTAFHEVLITCLLVVRWFWQDGQAKKETCSLMFGCSNLRKTLKTLEKNDMLSPLALCVGACCHHCDLMFARMFSNASLRISEAFSACFLALCLARPSFQSQPEISILILYLHTKNVKNTRQRVGGTS